MRHRSATSFALRLHLLLTIYLSGHAVVSAASLNLTATQDTTIYEDPAGALSNGAGVQLFVGRVDDQGGARIRRALLGFDLSPIPADSTVHTATLTLDMTRTISGAKDVALHRLRAAWGESTSNASGQEGKGAAAAENDATWLHRFFDQQLWSTPGGDFEPVASSVVPVAGSQAYTWPSTVAIVGDVQGWLTSPETNFGWIVTGDETAAGTAKRFSSRETNTAAKRPRLSIDFTVGIDSLSTAVRTGNGDAIYDVNADSFVNEADRRFWVEQLNNTYFGDADLNGEFSSGDLILVFQAGQYEDASTGNSQWATGDWNGDADFGSGDLILAFQEGGYEVGPRTAAAVPEPTGLALLLLGLLLMPRSAGERDLLSRKK